MVTSLDEISIMAPEVDNDGIDVPTLVLSVILESDLSTDIDANTEEKGRDAVSRDDQISDHMVSTGTQLSLPSSAEEDQIVLTCQQYEEGNAHHSQTQTLHFSPGKDVIITTAVQGIELVRECCMENCNTRSDLPDSPPLYLVDLGAVNKEMLFESLNIRNEYMEDDVVLHLCNDHFIDAIVSDSTKPVRRKRTIDQVLAEEAEKCNTLLSDRPKRKPKPSRVLLESDFAVGIHVKEEPVDFQTDEETEDTSYSVGEKKVVRRRKKKSLFFSRVVDKENVRPSEDEEEEYGTNISETSIPRNPPPRSKGRPPLIKDTGCQANQKIIRPPLRDVNIQCNAINTSKNPDCVNCSNIDWKKLQGYLQTCVFKIEGPPCDPIAVGCIKKTITNISRTSPALNVLKLLCGEELEDLKEIKPFEEPGTSSLDGDVEVFDWKDPEEESISDEEKIREIIPGEWRRKVLLEETDEDEEDEDEDDLFKEIEVEAEDPDDEEYDPGAADDEDWDIKKEIEDMTVAPKKRGPGRPLKRQKGQNYSKSDLYKPSVRRGRPRKDEDREGVKSGGAAGQARGIRRRKRGRYPCPDCQEVFTTELKRDRHHSYKHLGKPPWKGEHLCDQCGKVFTQTVGLELHKIFKHGAPRKAPCPRCDFVAPTKHYLKRHMKSHTGIRDFVCQYCGKGLKTADSYKNHLVLHTNSGRFYCEICQRCWNHKGSFLNHRRTHFEEREFQCEYCQASFKVQKTLAKHIRSVHFNERKFACDICGELHVSNYSLKIHIRKHPEADDLPFSYVCDLCQSSFRGEAGLEVHKELKHRRTKGSGSNSESKGRTGTSSSIVYKCKVRDVSQQEDSCIIDEESIKIEEEPLPNIEVLPVCAGSGDEEDIDDNQEYICVGNDQCYLVEPKDEVVYEVYSEENLDQTAALHEINEPVEGEMSIGGPMSKRSQVIQLYSCAVCGMMFTSLTVLEDHSKTHKG